MIGFIRGVYAQTALYNAANNYLKKRADAFMTITGYSLTPDVTTGSLSIRNKDGDNSDLQMISLGGGDRISANFPLYLRGTIAVNRYNPTFSDGIGNTSVTVPFTGIALPVPEVLVGIFRLPMNCALDQLRTSCLGI